MNINPKVTAATAAVAAAQILVWGVELAVDIPAAIEAAIVTLCVFGAGYLKGAPNGEEA